MITIRLRWPLALSWRPSPMPTEDRSLVSLPRLIAAADGRMVELPNLVLDPNQRLYDEERRRRTYAEYQLAYEQQQQAPRLRENVRLRNALNDAFGYEGK